MDDKLTKVCSRCGEEKQLGEFHKDRTHKSGVRSECGKCYNKRHRKKVFDREYTCKTVKEYTSDWNNFRLSLGNSTFIKKELKELAKFENMGHYSHVVNGLNEKNYLDMVGVGESNTPAYRFNGIPIYWTFIEDCISIYKKQHKKDTTTNNNKMEITDSDYKTSPVLEIGLQMAWKSYIGSLKNEKILGDAMLRSTPIFKNERVVSVKTVSDGDEAKILKAKDNILSFLKERLGLDSLLLVGSNADIINDDLLDFVGEANTNNGKKESDVELEVVLHEAKDTSYSGGDPISKEKLVELIYDINPFAHKRSVAAAIGEEIRFVEKVLKDNPNITEKVKCKYRDIFQPVLKKKISFDSLTRALMDGGKIYFMEAERYIYSALYYGIITSKKGLYEYKG